MDNMARRVGCRLGEERSLAYVGDAQWDVAQYIRWWEPNPPDRLSTVWAAVKGGGETLDHVDGSFLSHGATA